jgi:repressor of nif and glnA expression
MSLFNKNDFPAALKIMKEVTNKGLCVSEYVAVAHEKERLGDVIIPENKIGLATVCGVTINGVLLNNGVPMESKFAGVLEIKDYQPQRFIAIINYGGTSLDPSEQYIRAKMTRVQEAARTGNGRILANFREIPAILRSLVEEVNTSLQEAGINGIYKLGRISEPVCQIEVSINRLGVVLLGGLNPVAAVTEAGYEVENIAESGIIDFQQLVSIRQI